MLVALCAAVAAPGASAQAPQISSNYHQTCTLSDVGAVLCAGDKTDGALGDEIAIDVMRPVFAAGPALGGVTQLAAGERQMCGLITDGTVSCWGYNSSFELGRGGSDTTSSATPAPVLSTGDVPLTGVTEIASQDATTCARKSDGTAWCWGAGGSGQIGDGYTESRSVASQVSGLTGVVKVVPGSSTTCALVTGGSVYCWGSDSGGALGNGSDGESATPVAVQNLSNAVDIGAGSGFECALIADGTVKCWGRDLSGEQGNGAGTSSNDSATTVPDLAGVSQLALGYSTTCVLKTDATVYCWGYNDDFEAGVQPAGKVESPTNVAGATGAIQLAQQWDETACALYRGGGVKCWGYNHKGQAGIDNGFAPIAVPTDVPGVDLITLASPAAAISASRSAKTKLDKKKKTYTVSVKLSITPGALVLPSEACVGAASAAASYSVIKLKTVKVKGKKQRKRVKQRKTITKKGSLALTSDVCSSTLALRLPVRYFNGRKVKITLKATGNGSLSPVSKTLSVKLAKVKSAKS